MSDEQLSDLQRVDTIYGLIEAPNNADDLITRFLVWYGEWAFCEPLLLGPMLPENATVFDVGAFIGTFSLGIAMRRAKRVVAIEANPAVYPTLKRNLKACCRADHETVMAAVGASEGLAGRAKTNPTNLGATAWSPATAAQIADGEVVPLKTLAGLRVEHGDYDLLKLDVEGGERDALLGDLEWITANRPIIWAECNEDAASLELADLLVSAGLNPHFVAYPAFRARSHRQASEDIFPIAYEAALLAAPPITLSRLDSHIVGEDLLIRPIESGRALREMLWRTPRWGLGEWLGLSRVEAIALLGRYHRGERFDKFLM